MAPRIRLQNWRMRSGAGNERSLRLRFQSPISGEVFVDLDLVPVAPPRFAGGAAAAEAAGNARR